MTESCPVISQTEYARHRGKSRQYISRLAKAGVLVMRNGKVDVATSDAVLDDRPVAIEPTETVPTAQPRTGPGTPSQQPTSYAQVKLAETVYRANVKCANYSKPNSQRF